MAFSVKIEGLDKLLAKTNASILFGPPLRKFFTKAAIAAQGPARELAPVDTGRLRASIAYEIDPSPNPLFAKVGTNVIYAKAMEFGTGLLSDAPDSGHAAHYPPPLALGPWAQRHGMEPFLVARAIGRRGGLKPRRFLRGGLDAAMGAIRGFINELGADIKAVWDK